MSEDNALSLQRESAEDDTEAKAESEPRRWGTRQERERCQTLRRHVVRVAARHKAVRDLRKLLFGSETATAESGRRAYDLLGSPATRNLGPEAFKERGIPFDAHRTEWAKLEGKRPGEMPGSDDDGYWRDVTGLQVLWPGGSVTLPTFRVAISDARGVRPRHIRVPSGGGPSWTVEAPPGTWLDWIALYSERIELDFLWSQVDAVRFLLTGEAPPIDPVRTHVDEATDGKGQPMRLEVVLRVQPFVSMKTIEHAMATCRFHLGRRLRLGPPMALRTLAVYDFVEQERAREAWEVVPWARLVRRWDGTERVKRRGWGYGGDRGNFRRDYERARKLLIEEYMTPRHRADMRWAAAQRAKAGG